MGEGSNGQPKETEGDEGKNVGECHAPRLGGAIRLLGLQVIPGYGSRNVHF